MIKTINSFNNSNFGLNFVKSRYNAKILRTSDHLNQANVVNRLSQLNASGDICSDDYGIFLEKSS